MLEDLPVPNVSYPPNLISSWNAHNSKDPKTLFEFADGFFTYNASLLLFRLEFKTFNDDVRAYVASYGFVFVKDWWAINELSLYLPTDIKLTVHFYIKSSRIFLIYMNNICCLISNNEDTILYIDSIVLAHNVLSIGIPFIICFQQSGWSISNGNGGSRYFFQSYFPKFN